ncbi:MAG: recombinase family protein [Bacteroidia bacterium]|nr:recombinase family protein [Bacteroidia bacterium]
MSVFNPIDERRRTAIYVRISTASQKTDRQQEELISFAEQHKLNFNSRLDVFIDVVSGFKDGEERPNFTVLKSKIELGQYRQVLFSEFSRLDRKPSNLLRDLEWFQAHDCPAFFHKQNIWVRDKNDIGTQIMIQVLAVMSQYEIELFTSRGIDGKISAIKNRKTINGGFCAYGYSISDKSKLVINETEAAVVRRIFDMYLHGANTIRISETLNSENVPCLYKSRWKEASTKRLNKGLEPTSYKRGNVENMIWRRTTVSRILQNPVYIGIQRHKFHEPDPANPIPAYKREGRRILDEFEILTPETRIISDDDFYQVRSLMSEAKLNRNQGLKRQTLLKDLLKCGECGSQMCSVTKSAGPAYHCAGRSGRVRIKCDFGPCVLMAKLDGLVLTLCVKKFAQYDLVKKSEGKIRELEALIAERTRVFDGYIANQKDATEAYSRQVQLAIKYALSDDDAEDFVKEAKMEYDRKIAEYSESLTRLRNELTDLSRRRRSLMEIKDEKKLQLKTDEIMAEPNRIKDYIHDYVTKIVLYKIDSSWILVIVQFLDGSERWGTIKSIRYSKSELKNDDLFGKVKYKCWVVNNDAHKFEYDKDSHKFIEKKSGKVVKNYTFEQFDRYLNERGMVGDFTQYEFNVDEQ